VAKPEPRLTVAAPESSGVTISVTPDDLRQAAGRLRGMKEAFERLDDDVEHCAHVNVCADARVGRQLRAFHSNWYDRRIEMARWMEDLAAAVEEAAKAYRAADYMPPPPPSPPLPPTRLPGRPYHAGPGPSPVAPRPGSEPSPSGSPPSAPRPSPTPGTSPTPGGSP
jgi:hypothetical protein